MATGERWRCEPAHGSTSEGKAAGIPEENMLIKFFIEYILVYTTMCDENHVSKL